MSQKKTVIYVFSGVLSTGLLAYLLISLDWEILRKAFSDIHWEWLGMALLAYLMNIVLRAVRFSKLIYSRDVHWLDLVPVSALHNILTYLMPAKTGDASYIFIARNKLDVSFIEGTATLAVARFYDFLIVAIILASILPFTRRDMPDWIRQSSLLFCFIVLLGALVVFAFLKVHKPALRIQEIPGGGSVRLLDRLFNAWDKFITGLREFQSHGAHGKVALTTAGIWLCIYWNFYSAARSMGLEVSFHHVVIISIVMIPLTLLPLQGFANIGTHEVGWASVLVAFNYPYETALAIAAGSHFVLLISVLASGGIAYLGARMIRTFNARS